jgi:hypothetical protein
VSEMGDYPPPPVAYRPDGVTLFGRCDDDADCTLIAQRQMDGSIRLAYHGTTKHSMVLDRAQQRALADVLPALNPAWTYETSSAAAARTRPTTNPHNHDRGSVLNRETR